MVDKNININAKINAGQAVAGIKQLVDAMKGLKNYKQEFLKGNFFAGVAGGATVSALNAVGNTIRDLKNKIIDFGVETSKTSMTYDRLVNRFNAAAGGIMTGADSFSFIKNLSNDVGISFVEAAESFGTFEAAALRSGLTLNQTKKVFSDISSAVVSLQLDGYRTGLTFMALSQMASKNTVQMEELKRQLAESLPGSVQIGARAMNMGTAEFHKMVEEGKLLSNEFLPKFAAQVKKELGGSVSTASKQARADFIRFDNTMKDLKDTVGDILNPALASLAKAFIPVIQSITIGIDKLRLFNTESKNLSLIDLKKKQIGLIDTIADYESKYGGAGVPDLYKSNNAGSLGLRNTYLRLVKERNETVKLIKGFKEKETPIEPTKQDTSTGGEASRENSIINQIKQDLEKAKNMARAYNIADSLIGVDGITKDSESYNAIVSFYKELQGAYTQIDEQNNKERSKKEKNQVLLSATQIEELKGQARQTVLLKYERIFNDIEERQRKEDIKYRLEQNEINKKAFEDDVAYQNKIIDNKISSIEILSDKEIRIGNKTEKEKLDIQIAADKKILELLKQRLYATYDESVKNAEDIAKKRIEIEENEQKQKQRLTNKYGGRYGVSFRERLQETIDQIPNTTKWEKFWKDFANVVADAIDSLSQKISNSLADNIEKILDGTQTLKEGFKAFYEDLKQYVRRMIAEIIAEMINLYIIKPFLEDIFGSVFGRKRQGGGTTLLTGLSSGLGLLGFANGGDPPVGVPYIVGEDGPEIAIDRSPKTIIPNHKLGGGTSNYVYAPNIKTGASADEVFAILDKHSRKFFAMVQDGVENNSGLRNAVRVGS